MSLAAEATGASKRIKSSLGKIFAFIAKSPTCSLNHTFQFLFGSDSIACIRGRRIFVAMRCRGQIRQNELRRGLNVLASGESREGVQRFAFGTGRHGNFGKSDR